MVILLQVHLQFILSSSSSHFMFCSIPEKIKHFLRSFICIAFILFCFLFSFFHFTYPCIQCFILFYIIWLWPLIKRHIMKNGLFVLSFLLLPLLTSLSLVLYCLALNHWAGVTLLWPCRPLTPPSQSVRCALLVYFTRSGTWISTVLHSVTWLNGATWICSGIRCT